jgi:bifunctional enzyme CysN/CysC
MPPEKKLLRIVACGSVDDGKSSLLGRLLYETGSAPDDELAACDGDFSRLFDGLEAEREQGITIDVAYRYFETERAKFIVADAPGHEQYTRNLVTAASTADIGLVLVDARKGVLTQTRRHAFLCRLLGVRRLVLLVNKMDLAGYDAGAFAAAVEDFRAVAEDCDAVPISALAGDNVARTGGAMLWYEGPSLLELIEAGEPEEDRSAAQPLRIPVQCATRLAPDRRGFSGLIAAGTVRVGQPVRVMPAGTPAAIAGIVVGFDEADAAQAGQSVTIALDRQVDCSRGDVIAAAPLPDCADQFEADIVWMGEEELVAGRQYALKLAAQTALATLQPPKQAIDMETLAAIPARTLELNAVGVCDLWTDRPLVFAPYAESRELGGFILIDRVTNDTVAAGLVRHALRRARNIRPQPLEVSREMRAAAMGQKPRLLWFTGLSGAGKSTIANLVEAKLHARGRHTLLLDGDNVRLGLTRDLGFSDADRAENVRRVGEAAKLMLDSGLIVLAAFISPFASERRMVRELLPAGEFVEIFVDAPLEEAERRDAKGLYAKARAGRIPNFTGIGSAYEAPEAPELRLDTSLLSAEEAADAVLRYLGED